MPYSFVVQERAQAVHSRLAKTEEELVKSKHEQQQLEKLLQQIQLSNRPAYLLLSASHQQPHIVSFLSPALRLIHGHSLNN